MTTLPIVENQSSDLIRLEFDILLTKTAMNQLKSAHIGNEADYLQFSVKGGGCSGFLFGMDFVEASTVDEEYFQCEVEGIKFCVDLVSHQYLKGTTVDYVSTLKESGFKFLNPAASRTCGCGKSAAF